MDDSSERLLESSDTLHKSKGNCGDVRLVYRLVQER